jgi:hypothetical protein
MIVSMIIEDVKGSINKNRYGVRKKSADNMVTTPTISTIIVQNPGLINAIPEGNNLAITNSPDIIWTQ